MARFVHPVDDRIDFVTTAWARDCVRVPWWWFLRSSESLIRHYRIVRGRIVHRLPHKNPKQMRAAFVGVYGINCGIATYSKWLWEKMVPHFGHTALFTEIDSSMSAIDTFDEVFYCWRRGESLKALAQAINAYGPDVVYIQHEFGIFPDARKWLTLLSQLTNCRVIVTFHSTYEHKDKTVIEAAAPEIVVHTRGQMECLRRKGILSPIHAIPHGCHLPERQDRNFNIYRTRKTVMWFGFLFKYKGLHKALHAIAEVKNKHTDIFFTAICSDAHNAKDEMDRNFAELQRMVLDLKLEENVALIRGFQSEEVLEQYLRTNHVAIFPYYSPIEHQVYAASGAVRFAMKFGIPVVVSRMNHFEDLDAICVRADTPQEFSEAIQRLFDPEQSAIQVRKQNKFLNESSWQTSAQRYVDILK